jgi:hypothetical protein
MAGNVLICLTTVNFLRRILIHGDDVCYRDYVNVRMIKKET